MPEYTSTQILESDDLYALIEQDSFTYTLTHGEWRWVEFTKHAYAIAQHIWDSSEEQDNGSMLLTTSAYEISDQLNLDSVDRAPMLSEETALQKICWWSYQEDDENV